MSLDLLLSSSEVRELPVPQGTAIYFLVSKGEVVYIGQASDLTSVAYRNRTKDFDRVLYVRVPANRLDEVEQAAIVFFRPKLNKTVYFKKVSAETAASVVEEILKTKKIGDYPRPSVTVDIVLFGFRPKVSALQVLLIRRAGNPFKGALALPGGFTNPNEDTETAALRELAEETHLTPSYLEQLYTFSDPKRDPRGWVITVSYMGLVSSDLFVPKADSDAAEAQWYSIDDALDDTLAFDHRTILEAGLTRLRNKIRYAPVGFDLLPSVFTLGQLRRLYETILGQTIDSSNFRKKILATKILEETGEETRTKGRPAALYRFDKKAYDKAVKGGLVFEI